ncbi:MAG: hypothetical protein AB7R87_08765 [Parvibaculaceae bacterium]
MTPDLRRKPVRAAARARAVPKSFPAPTRGWVTSESFALDGPGGATVLENFFPTARGIRPRGGLFRHATIAGGVSSLMAWRSGTIERIFASDATAVYDVTAPADPAVAPAPLVSAQTSGVYASTMFSTSGGDFLVAVNGTDAHLVYDGSAFAAGTPAVTGVDTAGLSYVWVFKNRLFFIEKDTMNAWCLPVDSLGGAAAQIALSGVFRKGGSLLFGVTWSVDAGDGMDDVCVFVSTTGELAAFAGTDPADPAAWALVGTYDIGQPLGPQAHFRAGGDVIIATLDGLIPLSAAKQKDPAALSLASVAGAIGEEWRAEAVARRSSRAWTCVKWVARNMAIVGLPTVGAAEVCCFVVNLLTGAWAKYTGWDVSCAVEAGSLVHVGTPSGGVFIAEGGGSDDGEPYFSTFVGRFDHLGNQASAKTAVLARTTWLCRKPVNPRVSCSFDHVPSLPPFPSAAVHPDLDLWDVGEWDAALWDSSSAQRIVTRWVSVAGTGFALAPNVQLTNSHTAPPEAELVSVDLLYEPGGLAA